MTTLQRVQNMSKALLADGRKYVDDMEWLNERLHYQGSFALEDAVIELVATMSKLGRYSDIPIGNVFRVLEEGIIELGGQSAVGMFVEGMDGIPRVVTEIEGAERS